MNKRITATEAKNNFGGLLDDVAALGRVEVVKHGRVVAVVLSPHAFRQISAGRSPSGPHPSARNHMIPSHLARAAKRVSAPLDFDED